MIRQRKSKFFKIFVRKIKSNKGIIEVGKYGVDRMDVRDDKTAAYYTAGGNIFHVPMRQICIMGHWQTESVFSRKVRRAF